MTAKYPLFVKIEGKKKFVWKNLFKTDWQSILFIILVLYLAFTYKYEIKECKEVMEDPCKYCFDVSYIPDIENINIENATSQQNLSILNPEAFGKS